MKRACSKKNEREVEFTNSSVTWEESEKQKQGEDGWKRCCGPSYSRSWLCIYVNTESACRHQGHFNLLWGSKYILLKTVMAFIYAKSQSSVGKIHCKRSVRLLWGGSGSDRRGNGSLKDTHKGFWISCYIAFYPINRTAVSEILRGQIAPLSFNARPTNRIQRVFHSKCLGIVLSFQKIGRVIVTGEVSKDSVDILYYMHDRGFVLMISYLLQVFLPPCTAVNST